MNTPRFSCSVRPLCGRGRVRGMSLAEVMIAVSIALIIALAIMMTFATAPKVILANSIELRTREQSSRALRTMELAVRGAMQQEGETSNMKVAQDYQNTSAKDPLGRNKYIEIFAPQFQYPGLPSASTTNRIAFYFAAPAGDPQNGTIYYDNDISTAPNPALDTVLIRSGRISDFQAIIFPDRGCVWVHLVGDIRPNRGTLTDAELATVVDNPNTAYSEITQYKQAMENARLRLAVSIRPRM